MAIKKPNMRKPMKRLLTRSVRRHIRARKATIRRSVADPTERMRRITELYAEFGLGAR